MVAELRRRRAPGRGRDDLRHVATIAAKEDERIGEAVAEALDRVGEEGVVTVEESRAARHLGRVRRGHARRERPHVAVPGRATGRGWRRSSRTPTSCMTTKPISAVQELMGAIDQVMRRPRPLVILAEKVDGARARDARAEQPARHDGGDGGARARASGTAGSRTWRTSPRSPAAQVITDEAGPDARERRSREYLGTRAARDRHRGLDDVHRGRRQRRGGAQARLGADPRRARARAARAPTSRSLRERLAGWPPSSR